MIAVNNGDAKLEKVKPTGYYEEPRAEMVRYIPLSTRTLLDVGCAVIRLEENK